MKKFLITFIIVIVSVFFGTLAGQSEPHKPLQYHGGPILRSFKIYPLYYGNWINNDITAQQNYLEGLAGYLSGDNNPADQQPMMWQYGVNEVKVAQGVTASPNATPLHCRAATFKT